MRMRDKNNGAFRTIFLWQVYLERLSIILVRYLAFIVMNNLMHWCLSRRCGLLNGRAEL
jgi:hypothetical protein